MELIWTEKYRPKSLNEIVGQEHIVKALKNFVKKRSLPHCLFAGKQGIGKTTTALCIAKELYSEQWKNNFLEMNASVSKDTPVLVKINGIIQRTTFEKLSERYFVCETNKVNVDDLEVLTIDRKYNVEWKRATKILRHKAKKILRIYFWNNAMLGLTGSHSIIIFDSLGTIKVERASNIKKGDLLITFSDKNNLWKFGSKASENLLPSNLFATRISEKYIPKEFAKTLLDNMNTVNFDAQKKNKLENLKLLVDSDLHVVEVKKIEVVNYNDYVYDISVPDREMFFAGKIPILLHNSDERGIDTIRTKVKDFARTLSFDKNMFKIIYLDEADALTRDAQQALRRMMEKYTNTCRFILSVNYSSRIIPPIQSRCAVFRFLPIDGERIKSYLKEILKKEKHTADENALDLIIEHTEGDLRQSINLLQIASIHEKHITERTIMRIIKRTSPKDVKELMDFIIKKDFTNARKRLIDLFYKSGMDGSDIIKAIYREVFNLELPDEKKFAFLKKLGEYEFRMIEGSDPLIQLEAMIADMMLEVP